MPPTIAPRFCPQCGAPLGRRAKHGRRRPSCLRCGFTVFDDPKVAVGVVAARRGRLLLVRRDIVPHRGEWSFPSGYVDAGEGLAEAAVREVREETGVEVRVQRQLGAYADPGDRVVFVAYAATVVRGRIAVGPECQDVRYFPIDGLPALAFHHDAAVLRAWRGRQPGAGRRGGQDVRNRQ